MFTLKFNTDNAAFETNPEKECARLLQEVMAKLLDGHTSGNLRDVNGSRVGDFLLEQGDEGGEA